MKKTKTKKITNLRWLIIVLTIFIGGSLYMALKSGIGPLSFLATPSTINETKTICTRKTDGRKDCTTYETSTDDGIKTTTTHSEIISDTGGVKKVVEYKYDVVKTTPVNNAGVPTGNSTTTEVRKKVKEDKEEILSTVTTVQKPVILDSKGLPTAVGEVVSEVRTGDISLGVNPQDIRTPEQKCTQDKNGQSTENKWENDSCVMKVVSTAIPSEISQASSVSVGVNCDIGMCSTSGAPICYGSYASTGQYLKDVNGNSTGEYDCRLCGDNGSGGVSFTGGPQSCKKLLTQNKPVVLGPDANPAGLGLDSGVRTGSCLSKRGADWVLSAVGQPGEGPNEGKVCDVTGGWSDPIVIVVPPAGEQPVVPPVTVLSPEIQCHINHPGYLFGKNLAGTEVCLPNTATNQAIISNSNPCKPGIGTLEGKEVMISCSLTGAPTYTFCYGGTGTFDEKGKCIIQPNSTPAELSQPPTPSIEPYTGFELSVAGANIGLATRSDSILPTISMGTPHLPTSIGGGAVNGALIGGGACAASIIGLGISPGCALAGAIIGGVTGYLNSDNAPPTPSIEPYTGFELSVAGANIGLATRSDSILPAVSIGTPHLPTSIGGGVVNGGLLGGTFCIPGGPIVMGLCAGAGALAGGITGYLNSGNASTTSTPPSETTLTASQESKLNDPDKPWGNKNPMLVKTESDCPEGSNIDTVYLPNTTGPTFRCTPK